MENYSEKLKSSAWNKFNSYWKCIYLWINKLNKFFKRWIIFLIIISILAVWMPIRNYREEQKNIKNNEIVFFNQINIENLKKLKSRLDDLENEKNKITFADIDGKTLEFKKVQFWENFWTDTYSNSLNIITKNYSYDKKMVEAYTALSGELEIINNINDNINNLFLESYNVDEEDKIKIEMIVANLQAVENYNAISAFKTSIPIIINSYYKFNNNNNILDDKGMNYIKKVCNENSLWAQEVKNWLRDCQVIDNGPMDFKID